MSHPPLLGLRHVALKVKDLQKTEDFYTRILGFKVEWQPDPQNVYLSSGSDNLALHEVDPHTKSSQSGKAGMSFQTRGEIQGGLKDSSGFGVGAESSLQAQTGIGVGVDHFGLLVEQPRHVDQWAQYLKAQGVAWVKEPRTHRDGARSFYFKDPDGNLIQILYHPPISSLVAREKSKQEAGNRKHDK